MKKRCELCKSQARVYCDSDRASLCWTCDARVHSANFLVARHSRILLCQLCQSFTPWRASGEKLSPSTASRCGSCVVESHVSNDDEFDVENENDSDHGFSRSSSVFQPPPPVTSSSSSDEILTRGRRVLVKRKRRNVRDLNREYKKDSSSANKATSDNSMPSTSGTTFENIKRMRNQKNLSDDHITVEEEVHDSSKSAMMFDFDLNASP